MSSTNYGLIKNSLPAERQSGLRFIETFMNASEVSLNGGVISGTPTIDGSFKQNSDTDYISIPETNLGTVHSLVLKIKLNDYGQAGLGCAYVSGAAGNYFFFGDSSRLYYQASGSSQSINYVVPLNKEVTVSVVRNNTSVKFYVDESLVGSTTLSDNFDLIIDRIGRYTSPTYASDATYDFVKIFNTELSASDVKAYADGTIFNYGKDAELILPMNLANHDPTNKRTLDVSGKGNNATFGDGVTTSTFPTKIIEKHGYDFDGTADYMDLGELDFSDDFSVMFLLSTDQTGSTKFVSGTSTTLSASAIDGFAIYLGTIGTVWTFGVGDGTNVAIAKTINQTQANTIYSIGFSWNNVTKTITAYENGKLVDSTTNTSIGDINLANNYFIGKISTNFFNGKIYDNYIKKDVMSDIQFMDKHNNLMQSYNQK